MRTQKQISKRPARLLLATAITIATVVACMPEPPSFPGNPSDAQMHAIGFAVLSILARAAFLEVSMWKLFACLSILGAMIEGLQAVPAFGRGPSVADWIVDSAAIACTMSILTALQALARSAPAVVRSHPNK